MKLKNLLTVRWTPSRLFFAAAACLCLLLAILPSCGWLVRAQNTLVFPVPGHMSRWQERNFAEAAKHPGDFQMQFVAVLASPEEAMPDGTPNNRGRAERLWELRTRFPNEPAIHAAVIRYLTGSGVRTGRDAEQDLLLPPAVRSANADRARQARSTPAPAISDAVGWYTDVAKEGEKLDPQNGFFPMMQAVTFFATNQDAEGLAALNRAAEKNRWNDYTSEEAWAGDKLTQAVHGETGTIAKTSRHAGILFPHLAQYRATARVATALAVRRELAGDLDAGWAIRRNVARCGALMRSEASSYIGSLVGMAITQVAMSRPGGRELPDGLEKAEGDERARLRTEQFVAYARNIGRSDEAAFFQAESVVMAQWAAGSSLISNALLVLVLGGIAFGLARTARIRSGQPLHPEIRWGFAAVTAPIPFAVLGTVYLGSEGVLVGYSAAFLSVSGAAIAVLCRGSEVRRNLLIFMATIPSVAALLGLIVLGSVPAFQLAHSMGSILGFMDFNPVNSPSGMLWLLLPVIGGILLFVVWMSSLAILARCRRVPVSVGIVRGAAGGALTVASVLLFAYAAVTLITLRTEQQGLAELAEMTRHEGRYYARLAGKPWPGLPADR
jgi:hypothetical protein